MWELVSRETHWGDLGNSGHMNPWTNLPGGVLHSWGAELHHLLTLPECSIMPKVYTYSLQAVSFLTSEHGPQEKSWLWQMCDKLPGHITIHSDECFYWWQRAGSDRLRLHQICPDWYIGASCECYYRWLIPVPWTEQVGLKRKCLKN